MSTFMQKAILACVNINKAFQRIIIFLFNTLRENFSVGQVFSVTNVTLLCG